ncbi:MAG: GumC family protein [Thermoguttaceae bacterium]
MSSSISGVGLPDLWRATARHKKKSFGVFLFAVIVAGAAAIFDPKSYHSEGMLLVRLGKENAVMDPTVTMGQDPVVNVPNSRDSELNSVVEILKSQAIAEKVVDLLGLDFILGHSAASSGRAVQNGRVAQVAEQIRQAWIRSRALLRHLEGTSEPGDRDRAVAGLMARYSVSSLRKSDLIQIDCKGPSPQWSQKVVAALMEIYQSEHIRLNRPNRSVEFFAEQTERARKELVAKQEALRDLKTASGIVSPGDQRQTFATRLSRLEEERLQNQAARAASETRIKTLRKQLSSLPAEHVELVTTGIANEAADQMRAQLYQLEIRKEEAAAKYTDAHPAKQALDEQVQASRAAAEKQELTRTHIAKGPNRAYQESQAALLQEELLLAASQAKGDVLNKQLAAAGGEVKDFNQQELLIAGLERDIDVCQTTYRKYAAGMEQARIDQAREMQRISNITVAQPATYEPEVVFPKKATFLSIGVLCGLVAAVAAAWWAEARNHSFREPEDIERHLGVTVLGTIPRFGVQHFTVANQRRS